jgi:hypothetical protein
MQTLVAPLIQGLQKKAFSQKVRLLACSYKAIVHGGTNKALLLFWL